MQVSDELLQEVKDYLHITWTDETEDKRIRKIIERVSARISQLTGVSFTFEKEDAAKQLLFDGVRYVNNNSYEYFQQNFICEIQSLQFDVAVNINAEG
ncbi:hypothetical protein WJY09_002439 [Listeria monocytogenes]|nr:hypothetical protein [Listeria monocytogenes]EDN8484454.1 hypothetical protein [Listeria monocytogenes]EGU9511909.1 hypothetical protein [Listeria monocytogenes]EGU9790699.1 hypothetical protein [Listeria monocytogenes]EIW6133434.1 hypothetical protein [Listeria monocytogenes]